MSRNRITDLLAEPPPEPRRNRLSDLMDAEGWLPQPPQRGPQTALLAGPNAQTADLSALSAAMTMTDAGNRPETVWRQTGWWRNPAGQWRFEIDDSQSTLGGGGTVGAALNHEPAYQAYPELALMPLSDVSPHQRGKLIGAYAPPRVGLLGTVFPEEMHVDAQLGDQQRRSTLLHELQHAIDRREDALTDQSLRIRAFYRPNVNEADARLVETRRDYTPEQRGQIYPARDYDVNNGDILHNRVSAFDAAQAQQERELARLQWDVQQAEFILGLDERSASQARDPRTVAAWDTKIRETRERVEAARKALMQATLSADAARDHVSNEFRIIDSVLPFDQEGSH